MSENQKITAKVIIEMMGGPKDHIVNTMKLYIDKIDEDYEHIKVLDKFTSEPKEREGGELFDIFCELEIEAKNFEELTGFSIDYMPSSVEIVEPAELNLDIPEFNNYFNDVLGKLHKIGNELKRVNMERDALGNNGVVLLKNIILLQLERGPRTLDKLAKVAGVPAEHIAKFLEVMEGEGKIKKDGDNYSLA